MSHVRSLAAIVVVVLAAAACSDTDEVSTDADPNQTTTPGVQTGSLEFGGRWSRVPDGEGVLGGAGEQLMLGVTVGGPGLVAVGHDDSGGDPDAAVWTSPDGITWSRIAHDEAVFGGTGAQSMIAVVAGGPGLVAVGADGSGGDSRAAVWTSPDGVTWSRVPQDEAIFGGTGAQLMASVTAGGPGLIATGADDSGGDLDTVVWTSPDGVTWSRIAHDEAVFGGTGAQSMNSVAVGGPGLVGVGHDDSGGDIRAAVWTSRDGIMWSRVPQDEAVFGETAGKSMNRVTTGGPGLVAVGGDFSGGDTRAVVWTSPDGVTWSRVPHDEAIFGGGNALAMLNVTVGGPGLVAIGGDWSGGDSDGAVWTSPDGVTWSRVPHDEAVFGGTWTQGMVSVTVGGPGLVIVGGDSSGGDTDAAVWISPDGAT